MNKKNVVQRATIASQVEKEANKVESAMTLNQPLMTFELIAGLLVLL